MLPHLTFYLGVRDKNLGSHIFTYTLINLTKWCYSLAFKNVNTENILLNSMFYMT